MAAESVWRVQVVTSAPASLAAFAAALNEQGRASVTFSGSEDAVPGQESKCPDLVVLDERLGGEAARGLVGQVSDAQTPWTNFGVISSRPEEDFSLVLRGLRGVDATATPSRVGPTPRPCCRPWPRCTPRHS